MKRVILVLTCVFVALAGIAQTQQGYVKTKGRRTSKGAVAGSPLSGASIQVKGKNTAVSAASGNFSIPVTVGKFYLQSVKKSGYVLTDPDILLKSYIYSSNPLVIVMETPEQKSDDIMAAERKIRRTLQRQIDAKEDRIEELMEQNQITEQQYRQAMKALQEEQERNGKLVSLMAERYAQMDYDQMDEFNQQVSDLILEGNLLQADSLLRSKGDIDTRIAEVNEEETAQAAEAAELSRRQQALAASQAGTRAKKNDIAQDCYNYHMMFILDAQPDSALYYIEKRASIDPANTSWQLDAANYCQKRGLTQRAMGHYQRALQDLRQLARDNAQEYEPQLASALNTAALIAGEQPGDTLAVHYLMEAVETFDRLSKEEPEVYRPYLASSLNNLALYCTDNKELSSQCDPLFKESLDIYWQAAQEEPRAFMPRVAQVLNNRAQFLDKQGRFAESGPLYQDAINIYRQLIQSSPTAYNRDLAATLVNASAHYYQSGRDGMEPLTEALTIYRQLYRDDPQLYGPMLAATLNNLSVQHYRQGHDSEGEQASNEALDTYRALVNDNGAQEYKPELARRLFDQAIRLYQAERMQQSVPLFEESLSLYRDLLKVAPAAYQAEVPKVLRNLATALDKLNRLPEGEKMYREELAINQELARQNPDHYNADVARSYGNLSNHALLMKDFNNAIELANKGLAADESKLFIQANLAVAYLCLGETSLAEEIYTRYKSQLRDVFLDDLQQFTTLGVIPQERLADAERIRQLLSK